MRATLLRRSPAIGWSHALLAAGGAAICGVLALLVGIWVGGGVLQRSVENGGDWYARSPGWYTTRGLYPTEHAPDGAPYAWVGGRLRLQIPQLDRRRAATLTLHARSGRGDADPPVALRVVIDGIEVAAPSLGSDWQDVALPLRARPQPGAVVLIDAQHTFTPGPQDPRALAFMIDRLTLAADDGHAIGAPWMVLADVALFAAAVALAAWLCALPVSLAFATGAAGGLAAAALLLFDGAYIGDYSASLRPLAFGVAIVAGLATIASRAVASETGIAWRRVILLALIVTALRLIVFLHPAAPISDGMFHVHRAQAVRAGEYFFTSVTPRPFYEFPYPIGLYVAAQPLWTQFADRVLLLRTIALVADALVALGLFAVVSARWGSTATATVAAAVALAVPAVIQGISTANLTNVFAQSWFSIAMLWIGWHLPSARVVVAAAGAAVLLAAAALSHFSTAVVGAPAAAAVALLMPLARDPREARAWRWIGLTIVLAFGLAYAVYYSQFHEVYARTLSRIGSEGAETSFVATLAEHSESKSLTMARFLMASYGPGALGLAAIGAVVAVRRRRREGWTLELLALSLVVIGFLLLGALTPIEMRASLAAHPLVAAFAALGFVTLWQSDRPVLRLLAALALAWTVGVGVQSLRAILG